MRAEGWFVQRMIFMGQGGEGLPGETQGEQVGKRQPKDKVGNCTLQIWSTGELVRYFVRLLQFLTSLEAEVFILVDTCSSTSPLSLSSSADSDASVSITLTPITATELSQTPYLAAGARFYLRTHNLCPAHSKPSVGGLSCNVKLPYTYLSPRSIDSTLAAIQCAFSKSVYEFTSLVRDRSHVQRRGRDLKLLSVVIVIRLMLMRITGFKCPRTIFIVLGLQSVSGRKLQKLVVGGATGFSSLDNSLFTQVPDSLNRQVSGHGHAQQPPAVCSTQ